MLPIDAFAGERIAGVEEQLGGRVVELVGAHRMDQREFVDDSGQVRQKLAHPRAALSMPRKLVRRGEQLGRPLDEREPLAFQKLGRAVLPVVLDELGLVVEEIERRGSAGEVQVDDGFCAFNPPPQ